MSWSSTGFGRQWNGTISGHDDQQGADPLPRFKASSRSTASVSAGGIRLGRFISDRQRAGRIIEEAEPQPGRLQSSLQLLQLTFQQTGNLCPIPPASGCGWKIT
jgi:hypothetical protein